MQLYLTFSVEGCVDKVQESIYIMSNGALSTYQPKEACKLFENLADFEKEKTDEFENHWNEYFSSTFVKTLPLDQCQMFIEDPKTLANSIEEGNSYEPQIQNDDMNCLSFIGVSIEPCNGNDHIPHDKLEDEEDDGIVMSKDENEIIHFYWKEEALEDEIYEVNESEPLEPSGEGQDYTVTRIDGDVEDFDQIGQGGHLLSFSQEILPSIHSQSCTL